jgi:hypothetical protein
LYIAHKNRKNYHPIGLEVKKKSAANRKKIAIIPDPGDKKFVMQ